MIYWLYVYELYHYMFIIFLGELKDNIDKLVEELRFVVKSEKEIEDIIQVLDSIVNVSKTSIGGISCFLSSSFSLVLN